MGVSFPGRKCYEGVRFNVIRVARGSVGVKFPGKKSYVTLEWTLNMELAQASLRAMKEQWWPNRVNEL